MPVASTAGVEEAIHSRLRVVQARIAGAVARYREPGTTITLVAVSKTRPATDICAAAAFGQTDFGENYVQEALPKIEATADLPLVWHFIGRLQSNKCAEVAARFDWVHSIDREKVARRLGEARAANGPPVNVLIQVNLQGEPTKSGVDPREVAELAARITALDGVTLRGLMAIPAPEPDFDRQRRVFARLRALAEELRAGGLACDCLSMGMTADLEAAIAEGATHVRVGTAIFGPRPAADGDAFGAQEERR